MLHGEKLSADNDFRRRYTLQGNNRRSRKGSYSSDAAGLKKVTPGSGSYMNEADPNDPDFNRRFTVSTITNCLLSRTSGIPTTFFTVRLQLEEIGGIRKATEGFVEREIGNPMVNVPIVLTAVSSPYYHSESPATEASLAIATREHPTLISSTYRRRRDCSSS